MKRFVLAIIAVILIVTVSGCNNDLALPETESPQMTGILMFETEKSYCPDASTEVIYPYYNADYGSGREINHAIENAIDEYILNRVRNLGNYSLQMQYETMEESESVLSILFTGVLDVENAAHPSSVFFTLNIALPMSTKIKLSDVVEIDDQLVEKILTGDQIVDESPLGRRETTRTYLEGIGTKELLEELQNADSTSVWCTYIRNGHIGIVIPIPYAIGGFSQFEFEVEPK